MANLAKQVSTGPPTLIATLLASPLAQLPAARLPRGGGVKAGDAARGRTIELVVEAAPLSCPSGHLLTAGCVLVGWWPCGCPGARSGGGHRTWTCRRCLEAGAPRENCVILTAGTIPPRLAPLTVSAVPV